MKKTLRLVFSRVMLVSLGLALQIGFMLLVTLRVSSIGRWVDWTITVAAWCTVLYIMTDRSNHAYKMAWILAILTLPAFGLWLYIMFGGNRLSARLKRKMTDMDRMLAKHLPQREQVMEELVRQSPDAGVQARYLSAVAHSPVYSGTKTEYFPSGEAAFARMLSALEGAKTSIYLEYFILAQGQMWDKILSILTRKAAKGVDVRVIFDDFGCIRRIPNHYERTLAQAGIQAVCFNRFVPMLNSRMNNRDHRKLMIIDGQIGFTGGINLADEYINQLDRGVGHWKDCAIALEGEAVHTMTVLFLSMWCHIRGEKVPQQLPRPQSCPAGKGYVQPYGDSPLDFEATGRAVITNMVARAKRRVWIMTPYLIIDDTMAETLSNAAKSGLDVRIITPGIGDKAYVHEATRANYAALLENGVRIFEYTPGFVHGKVFLADEDYGMVGTVNLDFRSLYLHFEDGVWLYKADCLGQIQQDFAQSFPQCREIHLADCRVSLVRWLYRAVLRLISPLM